MARTISGVVGILLLLAALAGCGQSPHAYTWNYRSGNISLHRHSYQVTRIIVNKVGTKVGTIAFHDNGSVFALYTIPGHPVRTELAVRTKQGFLLAKEVTSHR